MSEFRPFQTLGGSRQFNERRWSTELNVGASSHEMEWNFADRDPALAELASFALELGRRARVETLARFRQECKVEDKGIDGTFDPVTEADRAAEHAMRQLIAERFPDHGIIGEEWTDQAGSSDYVWSLDPIDGTRSFICGVPTWTTLIALIHEGTPVIGVVDAPALDEIYIGCDRKAWTAIQSKFRSLEASRCTRLADARISSTDPFVMFGGVSSEAFQAIRDAAPVARYSQDGYAYARLAAGSLDLVIESGLKPHDYNALIPLVLGAGGTIGDWRGGQDYADGKIIAASTSELFDEAVGYFEAFA
jgi:histidinol-phosphatase